MRQFIVHTAINYILWMLQMKMKFLQYFLLEMPMDFGINFMVMGHNLNAISRFLSVRASRENWVKHARTQIHTNIVHSDLAGTTHT